MTLENGKEQNDQGKTKKDQQQEPDLNRTPLAPDVATRAQRDLAFKLSRLAHWLLNDAGYTKRMAATDLGILARSLSPEIAAQALGDAAPLSSSRPEGRASSEETT